VTARPRLLRALAPIALVLSGFLASSAYADGTKQQCVDADQRGQDLRRDGKLSAAREALTRCAATACPGLVRDDCTKRLDELEKAQPTILFGALDAAGNDVSAVKVTMDGQPFADRLGGAPLPVDPGEHTFIFELPGQPPVQKKLIIREGEKGRAERVTFTAPPAPPAPATPASSPAAAPVSDGSGGGGPGVAKVLAVAAGVVGVAGLGVGSAFGLVAISKKNDAQSACPGVCANASDASKWSDAESAGNISTVAFIVGGVALAAGVVLWVTAPSTSGPSAQVGVGPGAIEVAGTW
jgi:hypothetical protein